ncbi:hypothetical protein D1007_58651 [Hordeum vulgare]|nr:hypothetical protein D1007_58651 [Hordeum vulgare]
MDLMVDALSGTNGGGGVAWKSDLGDFMERLNLEDKEFDDLVIEEDDPVINEGVRWLALARVHTDKTFSTTAFYKDMRAAWNPTKHVRLRPVGPNLFVVHAYCLQDWERMVEQGSWLFRNCVCGLIGHDYKECGSGVHDDKEMKFGQWLYACGPNKARADESGRGNDKHKQQHCTPQKEKELKKAADPDLVNTVSSPSKNGPRDMQVDPSAWKRLAMELVSVEKEKNVIPAVTLPLTQGGTDYCAKGGPGPSMADATTGAGGPACRWLLLIVIWFNSGRNDSEEA